MRRFALLRGSVLWRTGGGGTGKLQPSVLNSAAPWALRYAARSVWRDARCDSPRWAGAAPCMRVSSAPQSTHRPKHAHRPASCKKGLRALWQPPARGGRPRALVGLGRRRRGRRVLLQVPSSGALHPQVGWLVNYGAGGREQAGAPAAVAACAGWLRHRPRPQAPDAGERGHWLPARHPQQQRQPTPGTPRRHPPPSPRPIHRLSYRTPPPGQEPRHHVCVRAI